MLDLLAMAKPLEPIKLPNGRVYPARPLDAEGWELVRKAQATGDGADALAALRAIMPGVTDEDLATLGVEDVSVLVQYAARQIKLGLDALGNSPGGGETPPTPPSDPPPTPSPS